MDQPQRAPRSPVADVKVGDPVRTPAGHPAIVSAVHIEVREATVLRLDDGESVRFRFSRLVFLSLDP